MQHYKQVYERLVLEECAAILLNSDKGSRGQAMNAAIVGVSDSEGFTQARLVCEQAEGVALADNDILLLTFVANEVGCTCASPLRLGARVHCQ